MIVTDRNEDFIELPDPKDLEEAKSQIERMKTHIGFNNWPDGSKDREKWLMLVLTYIPMSVVADACIIAKENAGQPRYLPYLEPPGWKPKADFTCWICGKNTPHPHTQIEIENARKTLEVFRNNVWLDLCQPRECGTPENENKKA